MNKIILGIYSVLMVVLYVSSIDTTFKLFFGITLSYIYLLFTNILPVALLSLCMPFAYMLAGLIDKDIFKVWSLDVIYVLLGGIILSEALVKSGVITKLIERITSFTNNSLTNLCYLFGCVGITMVYMIPSSACRGLIFIAFILSIIRYLNIPFKSRESSALMLCGFFSISSPRLISYYGGLSEVLLYNTYNSLVETKISFLQQLYYMGIPGIIYTFLCIFLVLKILKPNDSIDLKHVKNVYDSKLYFKGLIVAAVFIISCVVRSFIDINQSYLFMGLALLPFLIGLLDSNDFNKISFNSIFVLIGIMSITLVLLKLDIINAFKPVFVEYLNIDSTFYYAKLYFYSILSVNILTPMPSIIAFTPYLVSIDNTFISIFVHQYGLDQFLIPSVFPILMYFYLTDAINLKHFAQVFFTKALLGLFYVLILVQFWKIL